MLVLVLVCYELRYVLSSFAIILLRTRELDVLLKLSYGCLVTLTVLLVSRMVRLWYSLIIFTCVLQLNKNMVH